MYCLSSAVSCTFVDVAGGGDRHTSGIDCRPVAVRDWSTTPSDHDTLIEVTSRHGDGRSFTLTPRAIRRCRAGLAALAAAFAATHVYHRCLICRRGRGGDRGCWDVLSVAATDPLCGLAVLRPGQRGGHEANPLHPGRHRPGHAHCVVPSGRRAAPSLLCANCSRATDGPHPASCPPWNCLPPSVQRGNDRPGVRGRVVGLPVPAAVGRRAFPGPGEPRDPVVPGCCRL